MNTDKEQNKTQGQQSTADTNASYDRDASSIKGSSTTSQNSATSSNNIGVGGVPRQEDNNDNENRPDANAESLKGAGNR